MLLIHLNTFHTKEALDQILDTAQKMGYKYLLALMGYKTQFPQLKSIWQ